MFPKSVTQASISFSVTNLVICMAFDSILTTFSLTQLYFDVKVHAVLASSHRKWKFREMIFLISWLAGWYAKARSMVECSERGVSVAGSEVTDDCLTWSG